MKKFITVFFFALIILLSYNSKAQAGEINETYPASVSQEYFSTTMSGDNTIEYAASSISPDFLSVQCALNDSGNKYLRAYASTTAYGTVQQVGFTIYFQTWDGRQWVDIDHVSSNAYKSSHISDYYFKAVTSGRYYRIYVQHFIVNNNQVNFAYTTSTTVFIR
jgi:hypothetical protein